MVLQNHSKVLYDHALIPREQIRAQDLLARFFDHAQQQPEQSAYICADGATTYRELANRSLLLAQYLMDKGVACHPVLVWGHKQQWMPVSFLACMLAGAPYIPVDSSTPLPRLKEIIRQANPALILAVGDLTLEDAPVLSRESIERVCRGRPNRGYSEFPGRMPQDLAYIMFTSGSSGQPKGVKITWQNLSCFLQWMSGLSPVAQPETKVVLNHARFSFDLSVADLHYALYAGKAVHVLEQEAQRDFPLLFSRLKQSGADMAVMTPSFASYCMLDEGFNRSLLPRLKAIFFCGEPLPVSTVKKLMERFDGVRILNAYGPTETTVAVTAEEITPDMLAGTVLPVGKAGGENRAQVMSPRLEHLPEGEEGEIVVFGPSVGNGYIGLDSDSFFTKENVPGYRTGDRGVCRDGLLYCMGRIDRQIKHAGYRIELSDIEYNIGRLDGVTQCAVLYKEAEEPGLGRLTAFVRPVQGRALEAGAVKTALEARLPGYMIPSRIVIVEQIPLSANGKCDRDLLARSV